MSNNSKKKSPITRELIIPTFQALKELGGSGTIAEIYEIILNNKELNLTEEMIAEPHLGSTRQTELEYQLAWARTYLKNYGIITNTARRVWMITSNYSQIDPQNLDVKLIMDKRRIKKNISDDKIKKICEKELIEEEQPWIIKLDEILKNMDPYAFERLSMLLLREMGFIDVNVTKKSGDGGIDGFGKLQINGIITFNVAFQCKRYNNHPVTVEEIRNFRGASAASMDRQLFITTGTYSKPAIEEAKDSAKKPMDLIDGEEFIDMLLKYNIGVKEIKAYEVDEEFFDKI